MLLSGRLVLQCLSKSSALFFHQYFVYRSSLHTAQSIARRYGLEELFDPVLHTVAPSQSKGTVSGHGHRIRGAAARPTGVMGVGARGQGVIGCCDLGRRGRRCKGPVSRGSYGHRGHRGHGCELPSRPFTAFCIVTVAMFVCSLNCQPFKPP